MQKRKSTISIGNLALNIETEYYKGDDGGTEKGDVRVDIGEQNLCWVGGVDSQDFFDELSKLIEKYRI